MSAKAPVDPFEGWFCADQMDIYSQIPEPPMPTRQRTWMDVVVSCENNLGWLPSDKGPVYKARAREAAKLAKAAEVNREVTPDNLELVISHLRKEKKPVKTPYGLIHHISDALAAAYQPHAASDLTDAVRAALNVENARPDDEGYKYWIGRLSRAQGSSREQVLHEWKAEGRDR
jgi:hypothetical protein